jgi:crotonobetainyl-CoA:carnitine CoA-transferase CaiB-like acyl-CoA transferase
MNDFFKDLKVVELANVLAGPAVGMFFSELGATVLKIENKLTDGDVTRSWKLTSEDKNKNYSAYYASVNYKKKSVFLDFTNESDKQIAYNVIKDADIVISNYKPGDDKKLGFDYDTIKTMHPTIIYAHLTGFGTNSKRTAYDLVLQAETGFMHMNGEENSNPLKMPVALIDVLAAHQLKEGILIALLKKLKTGEGSIVTVSLYDSAIASLANQASNWLTAGYNPKAIGSKHPNIAPYGELFETADHKKIVLAIGNNKQFKLLCEMLGIIDIINDEKYSTNANRVKNRTELESLLNQIILKYQSEELMKQFIEKDIPAGVVKSLREVFDEKESRKLILEEQTTEFEGQTKRVKTVIFDVK